MLQEVSGSDSGHRCDLTVTSRAGPALIGPSSCRVPCPSCETPVRPEEELRDVFLLLAVWSQIFGLILHTELEGRRFGPDYEKQTVLGPDPEFGAGFTQMTQTAEHLVLLVFSAAQHLEMISSHKEEKVLIGPSSGPNPVEPHVRFCSIKPSPCFSSVTEFYFFIKQNVFF